MFKGRGGVLFFIIIIVLVVAVFFLLRREGGVLHSLFGPGATPTPTIPYDLQALIPPSWTVQAQPQVQCDFDGDSELEMLLIYTYNSTTVPNPQPPAPPDKNAKTPATVAFTPYGGVIYDTQPGSLKPQPDNPGPYRTSNFVPYKLLPDYYAGKGQGYLGESGVNVLFAPAIKSGAGCTTSDINIYGYSGGQLPTRLSVFRWAGTDAGYQDAHFPGDARVEATTAASGQITRVVTYNRLQNHRSVLCEVAGNVRPNMDVVTFIPDASLQTIDFCFSPPDDPVYPEGVVVAVLRSAPQPTNPQSPRYILSNAQIDPELQSLSDPKHDPLNIIALGNPSSVISVPKRGAPCTSEQISTAGSDQLWCDRQRARIETRIMLDGVPRDAVWIIMSVEPNVSNATLYWRVSQIELP